MRPHHRRDGWANNGLRAIDPWALASLELGVGAPAAPPLFCPVWTVVGFWCVVASSAGWRDRRGATARIIAHRSPPRHKRPQVSRSGCVMQGWCLGPPIVCGPTTVHTHRMRPHHRPYPSYAAPPPSLLTVCGPTTVSPHRMRPRDRGYPSDAAASSLCTPNFYALLPTPGTDPPTATRRLYLALSHPLTHHLYTAVRVARPQIASRLAATRLTGL
jgi:hypothetical protein